MENGISVIIPTYNRAKFLEKTIPTYLQEGVAELILVDDCSTDHTGEVAHALQKKYPQIRYYRNERNLRQTGAKNRALSLVTQPYVYFGDDDSVLLPGTIPYLFEQMQRVGADVMGAVPIYAKCDADMENLTDLICREAPFIHDLSDKVNVAHLEKTDFFFRMGIGEGEPVRVPFTHACALVKVACMGEAHFDTGFGGNSYREETDFWCQLGEKGYQIYFAASSHAAQINLPFETIGRKRSFRSMWRHGKWDIVNTLRLIEKHHAYFHDVWGYPHGKRYMKIAYVFNDCLMYLGILPSRLWGMLLRRMRRGNMR